MNTRRKTVFFEVMLLLVLSAGLAACGREPNGTKQEIQRSRESSSANPDAPVLSSQPTNSTNVVGGNQIMPSAKEQKQLWEYGYACGRRYARSHPAAVNGDGFGSESVPRYEEATRLERMVIYQGFFKGCLSTLVHSENLDREATGIDNDLIGTDLYRRIKEREAESR